MSININCAEDNYNLEQILFQNFLNLFHDRNFRPSD